jgi:Holliday junction resolvase-like predicted endonuclease
MDDIKISSGTRGGISELRACVWLLEQGYSVLRNVAQDGPIDVVAIKGEEILKIDVKTVHVYPEGGAVIGKKVAADKETIKNIKTLLVYPDKVKWFKPDVITTRNGLPYTKTKVTDDIARVIRASKLSKAELACLFDLNPSTVQKILSGFSWKHVA